MQPRSEKNASFWTRTSTFAKSSSTPARATAIIGDEPNTNDAAWTVPLRQRSVWQRRIATQFKMCLAADGGVVTARLVQLARNQTVRFISQLCVEEMFNRVKSNVGGSVNTRCTAQRAMAVAVDTGVLSTINRFNEVSRESQILDRGFKFDKQRV